VKKVRWLELPNGKVPFLLWIDKLDTSSKACILSYIDRVAMGGAKKNIKPLGDQIFEIKINKGPGFRVYFAETREEILLLILGGNKSSQSRDIGMAKLYWRNYVSNSNL
jgi:putative addiction module killer protein